VYIRRLAACIYSVARSLPWPDRSGTNYRLGA
jgi:hypothetical protein